MNDRKKIEKIIVAVLAVFLIWLLVGNLNKKKSQPSSQMKNIEESVPNQKSVFQEVIRVSDRERQSLEWGIDPFRIPGPQMVNRPETAELAKLKLTGILWSENRSAAIINDQIIHKGDSVNGCTILEIGQSSVSIQCEGQVAELRQGGIEK